MDDELLKPEVKISASDEESQADSSKSSGEDVSFDVAQLKLAQSILGERFEVLDVIGQGGMGSVYRVKDFSSEQIVALKLLKPELCKDKSARKRFNLEAEALSMIESDNIVSVYDYGVTENGTPYLVMEYLEGGSLDELLKRKEKLEVVEAIDIALEVCKALDYAHGKKLIHRDIKPSNVMIANIGMQESRKALLADFGIAKLLGESDSKTTQLTQTGDLFGTPAYMSPEQCEGLEVDHLSDIYNLGCLLYKMVTGTVPYEGATPVQMAVKHISSEPPRFAKDRPDGDPLLSMQEIIFKCMRKNKLERYQSVDELVEDLQSVKEGKVVGYTYDETVSTQKGFIAKAKNVSLVFFYFIGGVLSLCWYIMLLIYLGVPPSDSTSYSYNTIVPLSLFAILLLAKPIFEILPLFKKRASLSDWSLRLLLLSAFFTYLSALILVIPNLIQPLADLGSISLILSITSTIVIFVFCLLRMFGAAVFRTSRICYDFGWGLFNKSHKKFKHRSVPIRLKSALLRIALVMAIFVPSWMAISPGTIGDVLTFFGQIDQKYNGTFAEPFMKTAVKLPGPREHRIVAYANLLAQNGEKQNACNVLKKELSITPDNKKMLVSKATIEKDMGNFRQALTDINRADKLDPKNAEILLLRGQLFLALGENEKAVKDFKYALDSSEYKRIDTSNELYRSLALESYQRKNYQAAIEYCNHVMETGYKESRDYLLRALAYNAIGERKKADLNMKDAIDVVSTNESTDDYLVKAYAAKHLGMQKKYEQFLKKAKENGGNEDQITRVIFGDLPLIYLEW